MAVLFTLELRRASTCNVWAFDERDHLLLLSFQCLKLWLFFKLLEVLSPENTMKQHSETVGFFGFFFLAWLNGWE